MKKVLSLALVIVMMMALSISAAAVTVNVNDPQGVLNGHTMYAYQILIGDYDGDADGDGTLSNIAWGNGVDVTNLIAELKAQDAYKDLDASKTSCASDLAAILKGFGDNSAEAEAFIDVLQKHLSVAHGITVVDGVDLADGYYLIVDNTAVDGKYEVNNASLLQVVGENITITAKVEKPTMEKKVYDPEYVETSGHGVGYNDVATYGIGDTVAFSLKSTVPDVSQFKHYEYAFNDTLSPGLELDVDSIKVYVNNQLLTKGTEDSGDWHVSVTNYDSTNHGDDEIGATYFRVHLPAMLELNIDDGAGGTRKITKGDVITVTYNAVLDNDAKLGSDGNPNVCYLEFSNNPDSEELGKTPTDKVIVFTFGIEIDKVDGANESILLQGVKFVVWKDTAKSAFAVVNDQSRFAGWVTATESVTPATYSEAGKTAVLVTDVDGNVKIGGLDNGTYYAEEIEALPGYNNIVGLIEVKVAGEVTYTQAWDGNSSTVLGDLAGDTDNDWHVNQKVVNHSGTVLPETGGIGTVLFIAAGCVLILGASVVMVTRKKMSVYED